jgi:hypothetical protein
MLCPPQKNILGSYITLISPIAPVCNVHHSLDQAAICYPPTSPPKASLNNEDRCSNEHIIAQLME